jgi:predicted DsbA family dithiol-disulfide isomerase
MSEREAVQISYFSDVLCIWAYVAQIKVDEVRSRFGDDVEIEPRFITVFGNTAEKIAVGWKDRAGFEGYARHVAEITSSFPHVELHPEVWQRCAPASSMGCHLMLKAVQVLCDSGELPPIRRERSGERPVVEELAWRLRVAFFAEGRDVGVQSVRREIAAELELPSDAIEAQIASGRAFAALWSDSELQKSHLLQGSPTWLLNWGRQKLYGNVGYRVIEANVKEVLGQGASDQASWC